MRKKPMLYTKVYRNRNHIKEVIGLLGIRPGAGVTYTGILLAFYLGEELGRRTAFLEVNHHQDLSLLQPVYEWNGETAGSFTYGNITFYKDVKVHQVAEMMGAGYDYFILDFGTDFQGNKEEFLRCDRKLLLSGHSEWDIGKLIRFIRRNYMTRGSDTWLPLIPLAPKKVLHRLEKELTKTFYSVPFEADVTKPSKAFIRLFEGLLG